MRRVHGFSRVDPYILNDSITASNKLVVNRQTSGISIRSQAFNSGLKNLVLIGAGQSNATTLVPTLYTPSASVDCFNIYDGASYAISGPLIGTEWRPTGNTPGGNGNVLARLADLFISNAIFDRVILVPMAVGGTAAADYISSGSVSDRFGVTLRRLASRGYTVGATGLTFAITWWQGESDLQAGTSQASYAASMATLMTNLQALGFSGSNSRFFVNKQTLVSGSVSSAIQAAQVALPNGTSYFAGGDIDSLTGANRQSDNTHLSDAGAAAAATLVYNAMHASGAPY